MAVFAVLMPTPQPALIAAIQRLFPTDCLAITDTQWLISTKGTAIELTAKLGIYDGAEPEKPAIGSAIILLVTSYFGRAPSDVWDWLKAKQEASPRG
jgi:hypothetical protein